MIDCCFMSREQCFSYMIMVFNATFKIITVNIVVVSFIDGETGVPGENHDMPQVNSTNQIK